MVGPGVRSGGGPWDTVPTRGCGPAARSLTQRPLGPLRLPVGPESRGPPTHRAQQPRNRAAASQVPEIGMMVGPGVRSGGGPWDTVPTGLVGLRPGLLPSGRRGRFLPVGPESLGPPTHRAQQPRNRAATSQVLEIGTMVGPGVRSGGGPWDTVPIGLAGLRPGLLPSGRRGRCLLR